MGRSYYSVKISGAHVSLVRIELFGLVRVAKSGAETFGKFASDQRNRAVRRPAEKKRYNQTENGRARKREQNARYKARLALRRLEERRGPEEPPLR